MSLFMLQILLLSKHMRSGWCPTLRSQGVSATYFFGDHLGRLDFSDYRFGFLRFAPCPAHVGHITIIPPVPQDVCFCSCVSYYRDSRHRKGGFPCGAMLACRALCQSSFCSSMLFRLLLNRQIEFLAGFLGSWRSKSRRRKHVE